MEDAVPFGVESHQERSQLVKVLILIFVNGGVFGTSSSTLVVVVFVLLEDSGVKLGQKVVDPQVQVEQICLVTC